MKALTCPVIITSASTRADGSLGLRLATPELKPEEKTAFFELLNVNLKMLLQPNDSEPAELKDIKGEFDTKTPSMRLRATLFVWWKQQGEPGDFDSWYKTEHGETNRLRKNQIEPRMKYIPVPNPTPRNLRHRIHGMADTPTYKSWANMLQRCSNPKLPKYRTYGGRGISVCERWKIFKNFFDDMGPAPLGYTLERKDNNGNYNKENCCWIPRHKQALNRRNNRVLTHNGISMIGVEWARHLGIPYTRLRMRLHRNWTLEKALTQ